jgi:hypothetical protein
MVSVIGTSNVAPGVVTQSPEYQCPLVQPHELSPRLTLVRCVPPSERNVASSPKAV